MGIFQPQGQGTYLWAEGKLKKADWVNYFYSNDAYQCQDKGETEAKSEEITTDAP